MLAPSSPTVSATCSSPTCSSAVTPSSASSMTPAACSMECPTETSSPGPQPYPCTRNVAATMKPLFSLQRFGSPLTRCPMSSCSPASCGPAHSRGLFLSASRCMASP
uniref:Uncharacterized protein n=1 Tax=Arundo donax TaxID=35708 RepID=A0A0A8ZNB7_ARUDO